MPRYFALQYGILRELSKTVPATLSFTVIFTFNFSRERTIDAMKVFRVVVSAQSHARRMFEVN